MEAPDDIHLPELHGTAALPTLVVGSGTLARRRLERLMSHQGAIDRGATWDRGEALLGEVGADRARSPPRMLSAHLDDSGFDHRGHLVRTALGHRALVGQGGHATGRIATQPGVDRVAAHLVAASYVGHAHPVEDVDHRPIALFHQLELHQHGRPPSDLSTTASTAKEVATATWWTLAGTKCQAGTGASVAQVPEPRLEVSGRYRSHAVKHEPEFHTGRTRWRAGKTRGRIERLKIDSGNDQSDQGFLWRRWDLNPRTS
jgi:hypothetical protein